jgi:hypothetical protein
MRGSKSITKEPWVDLEVNYVSSQEKITKCGLAVRQLLFEQLQNREHCGRSKKPALRK